MSVALKPMDYDYEWSRMASDLFFGKTNYKPAKRKVKTYSLKAVEDFIASLWEDGEPEIDIVEGTLLDNYIIELPDERYLLFRSQYVNPYKSVYVMHNYNSREKCFKKLGLHDVRCDNCNDWLPIETEILDMWWDEEKQQWQNEYNYCDDCNESS